MRRVLALALTACTALTPPASAAKFYPSLQIYKAVPQPPPPPPPPPPQSIPWSLLGISPFNSGAANAAAFNSVCSSSLAPCNGTNSVYCDSASTVTFGAQLLLHSHLHVYFNECVLSMTYVGTGLYGVISQSDLTTPLTDVVLDGFTANSTLAQRLFLYAWVNNFTLTHFTTSGFAGFAYGRGANVEIGEFSIQNPINALGNPGIRWQANATKVAGVITPDALASDKPIVDGVACNVWVHDGNGKAGDGLWQISPGPSTSAIWPGELDSTDICYQNLVSYNTVGSAILVGTGNDRSGSFIYTIQNSVFENVSGTGGGYGVFVTATDQGIIQNLLVQDTTLDLSSDTTSTPSIEANAFNGGQLLSASFVNDKMTNSYAFALRTDGNAAGVLVNGGVYLSPTLATSGATIQLKSTAPAIIENAIIDAPVAGSAVEVGAASHTVTGSLANPTQILNNSLLNIPNARSGVLVFNADFVVANGNLTAPAPGATTARGMTWQAAGGNTIGALDSTAANNNWLATPRVSFTCNGGSTNAANNNSGVANQSCP